MIGEIDPAEIRKLSCSLSFVRIGLLCVHDSETGIFGKKGIEIKIHPREKLSPCIADQIPEGEMLVVFNVPIKADMVEFFKDLGEALGKIEADRHNFICLEKNTQLLSGQFGRERELR